MTEAWWNTKSYVKSRLGSNNCRSLSVFPAPAGMSPNGNEPDDKHASVPRTRGDEPYCSFGVRFCFACSPHPRG